MNRKDEVSAGKCEVIQKKVSYIDLEEIKLREIKNKILKKKEDKRNFTMIKKKTSIKDIVVHFVQVLKKSLIDIKNDTVYILDLRRKKGRLVNFDINEYMRYRVIVYDLFKFVPYSVILAIPLLEIFLPVYMVLFPNALPSQFFSEKTIGEINNKFREKQKKGFKILKKKHYTMFSEELFRIQPLTKLQSSDPENILYKRKLQ